MQEPQPQGLQHEGIGEPLRVLMPSPIGALGVELRGTAVVRLHLELAEPLRAAFTPLNELGGSDFLDEVFGRLSEYFAGARRKLDLEFDLAPCGVSGFPRRVLRETAKIPYGKTRTYQSIADLAGRPEAVLQVFASLLANPIPILIPCHRVVALQAELDGYVGGLERKQWLLRLESQGADLL